MMIALRLMLYAWCVIIALALLLGLGSADTNVIHPTTTQRIAALVFIVMLIIGLVVEFGWAGGDPRKR